MSAYWKWALRCAAAAKKAIYYDADGNGGTLDEVHS